MAASSPIRWARRLVACFVIAVPVATTAAPEILATSPLELSAAMSSNGRHIVWFTAYGPLSIVDRQSGAVAVYDLDDLRTGDPASVIARVFGISDDGRYLTYSVAAGGSYGYTTVARFDRVTREHLRLFATDSSFVSLDPLMRNVPRVSVSRDGQTFAWTQETRAFPLIVEVVLRRADEPAARVIGRACVLLRRISSVPCTSGPVVSGDGRTVVYAGGSPGAAVLTYHDVASGASTDYPLTTFFVFTSAAFDPGLTATADASYVTVRADGRSTLFDLARRREDDLSSRAPSDSPIGVSDDGGLVLLSDARGWDGAVIDRRSGLRFGLPVNERAVAMSADGSVVLVERRDATEGPFTLLVRRLDDDGDGMLDGWESYFGLDSTDASDAALDANHDGTSNLQTFTQRGHPTALASVTRWFAEGAGGSFFDTTLSLFNPGPDAALVVTTFLGPAGQRTSRTMTVPSLARADIASCCLPLLDVPEFSIVVESTKEVVAERRMSWDRVGGYGSHASTAASAPATTWYFAEGATIAGFQTFLLLQNPGATPATVMLVYLLTDGRTVPRTHVVPPGSRETVWVNQEGAPLDAAEFGVTVTASQPVVAERSMYRPAGGQPFGAGSNAMGVTAPATSWVFAEGATGAFFDTFILVANPSSMPGTVTAEFHAVEQGGAAVTVVKRYAIAAHSRLTIWVDQEHPQLASTAVSTVISADVPVVAERAMWWPGTAEMWRESHTEFGATVTGTRWAVADGEVNIATGTDTFVLVHADTGGTAAVARVTMYPSIGASRVLDVPLASGRNTLWMADLFPSGPGGVRFSVVVESLDRPGGPAPLVVEKAIYSRFFDAGAASLATRLPDAVP